MSSGTFFLILIGTQHYVAGHSEPKAKNLSILSLPLLAVLAIFAVACRQPASPTLDSIVTAYASLAVALGERDPDALDYSTLSVPADPNRTIPEIDQDAAALLAQLQAFHSTPAQQPRADYLRLQLIAISARTAMLEGHMLPFDREAELLFATHRLPDTEAAHRAQLRSAISALLPSSTKPHASLADRYTAYETRFIIPADRLEPVLNAALQTCRRRTLEYIALPPAESVTLAFVSHKPWIAFSHYLGHAHSIIDINLDQPLTVGDALELACHEGYPGHHVFNSIRDQPNGPVESHIQLTFSPQSYVSEAAAAYAPQLAFSTEERIAIERDTLFPAAGLPAREVTRYVQITALVRDLDSATPAIAREYLDGHLEFARAGEQLAAESLMANATPTLLYLNEYRSYMLAYTDGPRRLAQYLDTQVPAQPSGGDARWHAYLKIMQDPWFVLPAVPESFTSSATSAAPSYSPRS